MCVDEIVQRCYEKSPWDSVICEEVCDRIVNRVIEQVDQHGSAMPCLGLATEVCQRQDLNLTRDSTSPMTLISASIEVLWLEGDFNVKMSGAEFRYAKQHSEVYLNASDALSVQPARSVALEDSFAGLLAAKAVQMKTIVVPELSIANDPQFVVADRQLNSLNEMTHQLLESL